MAAKKRRTAAQIRATKKLVAFNKRRRKANPAKKKRAKAKVKVGAKSRITGKRPSAALKKRRAKNTKKGYFPNPGNPTFYVVYVSDGGFKYYYAGWSSAKKRLVFDSDIEKAMWYRTPTRAMDEVANLIRRDAKTPNKYARSIKTARYTGN